jgi:small subunit ribosomal protein S16
VAVRIRLKRTGRKNRPCYRIGVFDSRTKRDGKTIEDVGFYDPIEKDEAKQVRLDRERIEYWLSVGALPTETVASILKRHGVGSSS